MTAPDRRAAPDLAAAYAHCRRITRHHGRSYALATRLLPAGSRDDVHALYAFARSVDDLVDLPDAGIAPGELSRRLGDVSVAVARALAAPAEPATAGEHRGYRRRAESPGGPAATATDRLPWIDHRVSAAFLDTGRRLALDPALFTAFLRSMRMDIPGTPEHAATFGTMTRLTDYMHGSAEIIGLQMLPVLGAGPEAAPYARSLGTAFQMTNFLRDVGEDLDRGRIYLPLDLLAAHDVDEGRLHRARSTGRPDGSVRAALADFADHARDHYRAAAPGHALLPPRAARCVRVAAAVYGGILTEVEREDYRVFDRRIAVPRRRKYALAARAAAGNRIRTPSPGRAASPHGNDPRAARRRDAREATGHR